ncbi:hypothetical protein FRC05_005022 [Tulasnella sp. 425]|nr:hypothetical protein FRC05_005022 [Tulasnella sp. 425]
MAKDVLKVHVCRWNAKDSSHVRDSRTDCGAHLACFANLEKHLLNHARDAYNQDLDCWQCHFANCPSNFNFESEDHLKNHLTTSHLQRMYLVCPVAGCDEVTNKWYKLCNHVQTQHPHLHKSTKLKPTFKDHLQAYQLVHPAISAAALGECPTYTLLERQIHPADCLFLPSSPVSICTSPTKQHGSQLIAGGIPHNTRDQEDPYGSNLDKWHYKSSRAASISLCSNLWSSINPSKLKSYPVISIPVQRRLEGTSLIGAPLPSNVTQELGESTSKKPSQLLNTPMEQQGSMAKSIAFPAYLFPPAVPATASTIGFAQLWHKWRASTEGMIHGPEVEDLWKSTEKEAGKRAGATVQGGDSGARSPERPTAIKRTALSAPKAVARKTVSPTGVKTLKRKRRILSDSED